VVSKSNKTPKYGVLWFTARTEVDKVNRQVTLDNFQITKVKFPMLEARTWSSGTGWSVTIGVGYAYGYP
jgi:hypothetical protein